ncbi:hypothetical protein KAJ02_02795 [Candidatus Bipolaricaulota bacterium]|nr:hypothetical protein [Candidatus Bipolaricaulota bacterium]
MQRTARAIRLFVASFLLIALLLHTSAWSAPSISGAGSWILTIGSLDLIAGAGSEFVASYESAVDAVLLSPNPNPQQLAYRVDVRRVDTAWHGNFVLWLKRSGDGTGSGSISGGTTYLAVTTTDQSFFTGLDDRINIPIQLRLTVVSIQIPPGGYETTIFYTIVETG